MGVTVQEPIVGTVTAYNHNFSRILAGRRSWLLDDAAAFGINGDFLVLETSAVQGFSCTFYRTRDKILGLKDHITPIWNTILTYLFKIRDVVVPPAATPPGWKRDGFNLSMDSLYKIFERLGDLKANGESHRALALNPDLLPENLR